MTDTTLTDMALAVEATLPALDDLVARATIEGSRELAEIPDSVESVDDCLDWLADMKDDETWKDEYETAIEVIYAELEDMGEIDD